MKRLSLMLFFMTQALSAQVPAQLLGSYTGCGVSSALGVRKVVFHLTALPTDIDGGVQVAGSARWINGTGAIYFTKVEYKNNVLFMRTEFDPNHEFGRIINTLMVQVNADQSLTGAYRANSMQENGVLLAGDWTARKFTGSIPNLKCR